MLKKLKSIFARKSAVDETVDIAQETPPAAPQSSAASKPKKSRSKNPAKKARKPSKTQVAKQTVELSAKERATAADEPWVEIVKVDVDPSNVNSGSFTLDWNDKFVLNLIRAGYKIREDDTESDVVDRWFQTVCRNVALEVYEQANADPEKRANSDLRQIQRRDLGDGRSEIS